MLVLATLDALNRTTQIVDNTESMLFSHRAVYRKFKKYMTNINISEYDSFSKCTDICVSKDQLFVGRKTTHASV